MRVYRFNRSLPPAALLQPSFCDTGRLASVELPQGVADAVCHQALPLGIGVQPVRHQLDLYLFVTWAFTNQAKGRELARFSGGGQLEHQRLMRGWAAACFFSDGAAAPMSEFALP